MLDCLDLLSTNAVHNPAITLNEVINVGKRFVIFVFSEVVTLAGVALELRRGEGWKGDEAQ